MSSKPPPSFDLPLLGVPNVSEGRDLQKIDAIASAFTAQGAVRLLDVHSDIDHHRSVFTLAGAQGELSAAMLAGAHAAIERIDVGGARDAADVGQHPHVGALDVAPIVYLDTAQRGAACTEALVLAAGLGDELRVPVFLYGVLASGRTRAQLRRGGVAGLAQRMKDGELRPDFGPAQLHPTAGATLVAAREPLVAFNLELAAPAGIQDAKRIAGLVREGGPEGLAGVRAIAIALGSTTRAGKDTEEASIEANPVVAQVSTNVEAPLEVPLRAIVEAVSRHADVACVELVGLAPRAALDGFPAEIPFTNFDPGAHVIENALGF